MAKAPAFQFYPKDYMTDAKVCAMTYEERGVYVQLLCHCWLEGHIPEDPARLAMILGMREEDFNRCWEAIRPCFSKPRGGTKLVQKRLRVQALAQKRHRQRLQQAGREGARKVHGNKQLASQAKARPKPGHGEAMALHSSYSNLRSSSSREVSPEKNPNDEVLTPARGANPAAAVVVGNSEISPEQAKTALKTLKESDRGRDRPRSEPQPLGGMLGGRPKDRGAPVNGERLADWILAAWGVSGFNGCRSPTIRDAEQIADVLMREGPRSQITQAATRMVEVLADEAAEKRLKDPLAYLFGVLSKGGLVGWLEKETKAERKKRESAELKAAVDEGRRMAEEGRR